MSESYRTWVYHQSKLPQGKIVSSEEAATLLKKGWVDTPAKFGKGVRGKYYSLNKVLIEAILLLKKEWKWIIGTVISVAGLYVAYLKL